MMLKMLQNSQEMPVPDSLIIKWQASVFIFIRKGNLAQVFSFEFFEFFKNTSFTEHRFYFCIIKPLVLDVH